MKKLHLFKTVLLLCALVVGSSSVWGQVTIWSEDFSGYSANDVPSGTISPSHTGTSVYASGTLSYSCTNGSSSNTKIYNEKRGGHEAPELLVGKNNGTFTATIPLDNIEGTLTLKWYQNRQKLHVYSTTEGVEGGYDEKPSSVGQQTTTFTGIKSNMTSLTLVFQAYTSNVRVDNIILTGTPSAVAPTAITFKTGGTTYTTGGETKNDLGSGASVDITIEANQTADIYYTVDGTTPTTSSTKYSAPVAITGPCTLKALAKNTAGEFTQSAAFKFSRANGLAFGESEYTAYLSEETFSTTLTNPNSLAVTYSSTDEDVATVASNGTVTLKAAGETTIKATFAGNDTYAVGNVSYLLTVSDKSDAGLAFATDFYHIEEPTYNSEISAPVALTNPHSVTVEYSSSDATVATVNASTGAVTPKKLGTTTITATFDGNATYEAAAVSYTLKLGLQDAGLLFEDDSKEITYVADATYTNVFTKDTDADATFASSNTSVATVNATTGQVTVKAVGTTTISATTAKTSDYKAGEAEYTLTVTENTEASGATAGGTQVFYESFNKNNGSGGNDDTWSGISNTSGADTDNDGWIFSGSYYKANQCQQLGKGSGEGSATTPGITLKAGTTYSLTFKAGGWRDAASPIVLSSSNCTLEPTGSFTITDEAFSDCSASITTTSDTDAATITFATDGKKRLFLDEVTITQPGTPTVSVTVPSSGWGTYCSPYKLDLSDAATEVQAYAITGYNASEGTITLAKVSGVVSAKTPLVIKGETGSKKIAVSEDSGVTPSNELTGYLSPTYYNGDRTTNTAFGMSSGNFHKLEAGTIPANRAVLFMPTSEAEKIPAEARLTFIFDEEGETTGVKTIEKRQVTIDGYYNLNGQRVAQPTKGLYIVNGRKVVIK